MNEPSETRQRGVREAAAAGVTGPSEKESDVQAATVREILPNRMFRVETAGGRLARAFLAGEARSVLTRLVPGDRVLVQPSANDPQEMRILGRPQGVRGR